MHVRPQPGSLVACMAMHKNTSMVADGAGTHEGRKGAAIADESFELVLPLMQALTGDLLPAPHAVERLLGVDLHSYEAAVEHALGEWERVESLAAR